MFKEWMARDLPTHSDAVKVMHELKEDTELADGWWLDVGCYNTKTGELRYGVYATDGDYE